MSHTIFRETGGERSISQRCPHSPGRGREGGGLSPLWGLGRGVSSLMVLLAILVSVHGPAAAADWFVNNSCGSSGTGITQTCGATGAFRTIKEALDNPALAAGDTIRIKASGVPYNEAAVITGKSGIQGSPITVTRYDGDMTKPTWRHTTGEMILVQNPWWVFDNIDFDGNAGMDDLFSIRGANVTIRNCLIHNNIQDGISIGQGGDNLTVDNCGLYDLGADGDKHAIVTGKEGGDLTAYTLTGLTITNNYFHHIGGDSIQIFETSGACRQATVSGLIDNNRFEKFNRAGHENAIDIKSRAFANDPLIISNNTITGWDGSTTAEGNRAVVIQHCSDHMKVRGNFFRRDGPGNTGQSCSPCIALTISASTATASAPVVGIEVSGNIFVNHRDSIQVGEGSSNNAFQNLKIWNNTSVGASRSFVRIAGNVGVGSEFRNNLTYNQNVLSLTTGGALSDSVKSHNGWFGTSTQQSSCGQLCDPTDTTGTDPLLVNAAAGDYHLVAGSPAIDKGVDVGLPFSGAAPDLGAVEQGAGGDGVAPAGPTGLQIPPVFLGGLGVDEWNANEGQRYVWRGAGVASRARSRSPGLPGFGLWKARSGSGGGLAVEGGAVGVCCWTEET